MNLTGGNTLPSIGKRINWQLVTLLGGLAVAVSAGALAGAFDRDGGPITSSTTAPVADSVAETGVQAPSAMEVLFYVVGSGAEAGTLQRAFDADSAVLADHVSRNVVVAGSPKQEVDAFAGIAMAGDTLRSQGIELTVIDLRAGEVAPTAQEASSASAPATAQAAARPVVYIVGTVEQEQALAADLETRSLAVQGYDVPLPSMSVFVIDSPDDEYLYYAILADQKTQDSFDIVDLR